MKINTSNKIIKNIFFVKKNLDEFKTKSCCTPSMLFFSFPEISFVFLDINAFNRTNLRLSIKKTAIKQQKFWRYQMRDCAYDATKL